ncbi:MAG: class I SAM-dependent methyltransferase [Gemmatimonadota bacterium]
MNTANQVFTLREWQDVGLACPGCSGEFGRLGRSEIVCGSCSESWPVHFGIPDLRTGPDPYLSTADDVAAAAGLANRDLQFPDLYAAYYEGNEKVTAEQAFRFIRGVVAASARAEALLDDVAPSTGLPATPRTEAPLDAVTTSTAGLIRFLDLGCGTAPLAIAAARRGVRCVGVDVGLRWLVLAAARIRDAGVRVPLVCANAERLPFRDGTFDTVGAESVIENVAGARAATVEAKRVLKRPGRFFFSAPNKWSLGPDPHTGLPAAGYWPDLLFRRTVVRRGAVFPRRFMRSASDLRALLEDGVGGFRIVRLGVPLVPEGQLAGMPRHVRLVASGYNIACRVPPARWLLLRVGPTIVCVAEVA